MTKATLELLVRHHADYFVIAEYPQVLNNPIPLGVFKEGKKYLLAIIPMDGYEEPAKAAGK